MEQLPIPQEVQDKYAFIVNDGTMSNGTVHNFNRQMERYREAAAFGYSLAMQQREWIPVEKALPKKGQRVLITAGAGWSESPYLVTYNGYAFGEDHKGNMNATHWMPLPSPPKE